MGKPVFNGGLSPFWNRREPPADVSFWNKGPGKLLFLIPRV
jgi:hypothetical protein